MPFKFNPFTGNFDEVQDETNEVNGPASSTDDAIARFDGTTGKLIQDSNVTIDDSGNIANASIDADSNTITNIEDADIKAGAAISLAKLAALTANRALTSDASGVIVPSSVTDTELGYLSGVTSAIQTQLNSKLNLSGGTMTGVLTLSADAINPLEAVTKQQLDAALDGVQRKSPVEAATTGNITLSGEQTIDGIALVSGDRVLVKDQTNQTENGIYVVAVGAWSRSSDANTSAEISHAITSVKGGSTNADKAWEQTTNDPNIGVDNIVWIQTYGAGTYSADGVTLQLTGSTFSIANGGVSNAQVNAAAGIVYSKLNLTDSIVNADINSAAAIAYSKLSLTGSIVDADINASAAIALTKLAALTADRAVISDGSGFLISSSVTSTEVGYLSGVTSSIQAQLDSKAPGFVFSSISSNTNAATGTTYLTDSSGGAFTVTLPAPSTSGEFVRIKTNASALAEPITVAPNSTENIDGSNSNVTMDSNWESKTFVSDGTDWYIF
jgi:hypothetical protein